MYNQEILLDAIKGWRNEHKEAPTRGLDDLMSLVKQVYEQDIVQMENIEFLKHIRFVT